MKKPARARALCALAAAAAVSGCRTPTQPRPRVPPPSEPVTAHRGAAGAPVLRRSADPAALAVPRIDAALKRRLRATLARGLARGNRPHVFAKLGDSITESASFLQDIGRDWHRLDAHADLADTVAFFRRARVDREGNDPFAHASAAAQAGWTAADALAGRPSAVARELDALRPAIALVMFGTNDVDRTTPGAFAAALGRVLDECAARGVIAVPSTIPPRADAPAAAARVPEFNRRIAVLATDRALPLIDLHAAMAALPGGGLSSDGVHPSAYTTPEGDVQAANFTAEALRHGYNVRNLVTLRTLAKLRAIVLDDGPPEP